MNIQGGSSKPRGMCLLGDSRLPSSWQWKWIVTMFKLRGRKEITRIQQLYWVKKNTRIGGRVIGGTISERRELWRENSGMLRMGSRYHFSWILHRIGLITIKGRERIMGNLKEHTQGQEQAMLSQPTWGEFIILGSLIAHIRRHCFGVQLNHF